MYKVGPINNLFPLYENHFSGQLKRRTYFDLFLCFKFIFRLTDKQVKIVCIDKHNKRKDPNFLRNAKLIIALF